MNCCKVCGYDRPVGGLDDGKCELCRGALRASGVEGAGAAADWNTRAVLRALCWAGNLLREEIKDQGGELKS